MSRVLFVTLLIIFCANAIAGQRRQSSGTARDESPGVSLPLPRTAAQVISGKNALLNEFGIAKTSDIDLRWAHLNARYFDQAHSMSISASGLAAGRTVAIRWHEFSILPRLNVSQRIEFGALPGDEIAVNHGRLSLRSFLCSGFGVTVSYRASKSSPR